MRNGKVKIVRSGANSKTLRLTQSKETFEICDGIFNIFAFDNIDITTNISNYFKVKEIKKYTGFVSFAKSACGKDFLAALQDRRVQ